MMPKVENEKSILLLHERMRLKEVQEKLETVPVLAMIESARGL